MARATTKEDLLINDEKAYKKLLTLIESIDIDDRNKDFTFDVSKEKQAHWTRDKNMRDVIIHLVEWQKLLIDWIESNQGGEDKQFLREGYNWRTYGDMNIEFVKEHQNTSLEKALSDLDLNRDKLLKLAESFSNDELFKKGVFTWTGGSTLGSYFVSTTSSHYEWATKKLNKFKKSL